MSSPSSKDNPKKLMNELGELVDFLSDGPELQGELKLPQEGLFSAEDLPNHLDVPVLTVKVDGNDEDNSGIDTDALIEELLSLVMPRLETELRRRLKKKISDLPE